MSRFILGDCVQVMSRFPSRAVDFILTDPPYLVGYKDRTGRTIAGDNTSEWLQPATVRNLSGHMSAPISITCPHWPRPGKRAGHS